MAASDHDAIADEHTLEVYHHLPNAELVIFPRATHMIPGDDPDLLNAAVDRFFRTPSNIRHAARSLQIQPGAG
jgi:pimeloyl-ACP methyl ester carboxylesterase